MSLEILEIKGKCKIHESENFVIKHFQKLGFIVIKTIDLLTFKYRHKNDNPEKLNIIKNFFPDMEIEEGIPDLFIIPPSFKDPFFAEVKNLNSGTYVFQRSQIRWLLKHKEIPVKICFVNSGEYSKLPRGNPYLIKSG